MTHQHTTHPLAAAYLRELDRLLAGLGPGDRAEVLTGVREHIDDALAGRPQPGAREVQAVLAELGPPEAVADEAYAGLPAATPLAPPPRRLALERAWVPTAVVILLSLALLGMVSTWAGMVGYAGSGTDVSYTAAFPTATFVLLLVTSVLWVPAAALALMSSLWSSREGRELALLAPGVAVAMTLLPDLGYYLSHREIGINIGAWSAVALALLGGSWLLWHHTRAAMRRAGA
jgi:hypothetical protein